MENYKLRAISLCLSLLFFVVGANTAEENTKINEFLNLRKELRAFKNVQLNLLLSLRQFHDYGKFLNFEHENLSLCTKSHNDQGHPTRI